VAEARFCICVPPLVACAKEVAAQKQTSASAASARGSSLGVLVLVFIFLSSSTGSRRVGSAAGLAGAGGVECVLRLGVAARVTYLFT
jgi:hypothetical protein